MTLQETEQFFHRVRYNRSFFGFVIKQGIRVESEPFQKRNHVFKMWKERWRIQGDLGGGETVLPHFETHGPGDVYIHIEIDPYEGSINTIPGRAAYLEPLLRKKQALLSDIRSGVLAHAEWVNRFRASALRLGRCDAVSTLSAVRFSANPDQAVTPNVFAQFLVSLLTDLIPFVEARVAQHSQTDECAG